MIKQSILFLISFVLTGCASIIKGSTQDIVINTYPDDAEVIVKNSDGNTIKKIKTPDTITLRRSDGSYFGSETYHLEIKKDGYSSQHLKIESDVNNWYLFGNFMFGGLIGWFIVDPVTGRMYDLKPEVINEVLIKEN